MARSEQARDAAGRAERTVGGQRIARELALGRRIACITLDYELDYGDRIDAFNILTECAPEIAALKQTFAGAGVPVTAFIRTDLFERYPESAGVVRALADDFHCHSHTHATRDFDSEREFAATRAAFEREFGRAPTGYRAPQGVLNDGDIARLKDHGFAFSSSVFPSFRPGKYNNLAVPNRPFVYENGMIELPMSSIPGVRYTISLSYLKLLGYRLNRLLYAGFGLPEVLVFDSHLHDYIHCAKSFDALPTPVRLAWSVNKRNGVAIFERFVAFLRRQGYEFVTVSDLYDTCAEAAA